MKTIVLLVVIAVILSGCGGGNTEQFRTTVSDYNVFEGGEAVASSNDSLESTSSSSNTSTSLLGSWKLVSSSGGYPHAVGSSLTISESSFALTQPGASGSYTVSGTTFSFNFGGGMIIRFTYSLSGNTLTFTGIDYAMNMSYARN